MGKKEYLVRKAVREYYENMGNRNGRPVKFIASLDGYKMLLVRFQDEKGKKMSALMEYSEYTDHWDVSEDHVCTREEEADLVDKYESSLYEEFLDYDGPFDDEDEYTVSGPNGTWGGDRR